MNRERARARAKQKYVAEILAVYLDADELTQQAGREWYALERTRCEEFGARHGITGAAVAGAAAAISPGMRWSLVFAHLEALMRNPRSKVPTYSRLFVRRAVRCLRGEDPAAVLSGPKVLAFYGLLSGTNPDAVVIDRHAFDICIGQKHGVRDASIPAENRITSARCRLAVEAYREAAEVLGEAPHAVQAATWIHWRRIHGERVEWRREREAGED